MKLKYYKSLDGLRAIAAIMVVIYHFYSYKISSYVEHHEYWRNATTFLQHGVSMFFVLSGFVITRILIEDKNRLKGFSFFSTFYLKRVLRIFPLYYTFLVIWYLSMSLLGHSVPFTQQIPYYLFIQNFSVFISIDMSGPGHYWTLAIEEHFYLFWPLLIYFFPSKRIDLLAWSIIIISTAFKLYFIANDLSINKFTLTRMDQLAFGALIAYYEIQKSLLKANRVINAKVILSSLIILSLIFVSQYYIYELKELLKYPFLGIFFSFIIVYLISEDNSLASRLLSNALIQLLGKLSYGIYVWHVLVYYLLEEYFVIGIPLLDISNCLIFTVVISYFSYEFIEKPFLLLKRKLVNKQKISTTPKPESIY